MYRRYQARELHKCQKIEVEKCVNEKQNNKSGYRLSERQEDGGDLSAYGQRACQTARSSDVMSTRAALAVAVCPQHLILESQRAAACRGLAPAKVTTAMLGPLFRPGTKTHNVKQVIQCTLQGCGMET